MADRLATFEFLERCRAAASQEEISRLLFREMARCGIEYVACASHVDPMNVPPGAVAMINYPLDWQEHFSIKKYIKRDPICRGARLIPTAFSWAEMIKRLDLARDQKRILSEARDCGLVNGWTIPIHSPGALAASCSIVPGPDGFDPLHLPDLQFMVLHAHEEARLRAGAHFVKPVTLTERQQEVLVMTAAGKSAWVIGRILDISERTVQHTLEHAMARYGVSSKTQAVARAVMDGQVLPQDLINAAAEGDE